MIFCLVMAVALVAALQSSAAQGIKRIGAFGDWSSFQFNEDGNPACYMSSEPQKAVGKYKKRGEIYAIVTHRRTSHYSSRVWPAGRYGAGLQTAGPRSIRA